MRAVTLLFWLLGSATTSSPRLHVDIVFEGAVLRPAFAAAIIDEAAVIWSPYGVDIHARSAGEPDRSDAIELTVTFDEHADRRTAHGALGSILFVDDSPHTTIAMYPTTIAMMLSTATVLGRKGYEWLPAFGDLVLGRVVGRALAHEIGHFLLRSSHHSPQGLMRAKHSIEELAYPDRRPYALSADDMSHLVSAFDRVAR